MILATKYDIVDSQNQYVFKAAPGAGQLPSIAAAAARLYLPSYPIEVLAWNIWTPASDILTGAGGAANLRIALANGTHGTLTFLVNAAIGTITGNGEGGGFYTGGGGTSNVKPSFNLYPGSYQDSTNATIRELAISSDAGTINGTLFLQMSWRRITIAGVLP